MAEKRWALSVPMDTIPGDELPEVARVAEALGYTDAWSFEVDGTDCLTPLAAVALSTGMRIGTALVNVYTRGPATIAQSAAGLAELAPERFELGIGSGSQPIVEMWNGGRFEKPATRVREMVEFLRMALAGERVVYEGETIRVDGFRLSRVPSYPVPIHVGALRENMLRVAGAHGDGAIINWLSAEDVKKSVSVVRAAAIANNRDPDALEITARLMVCVDPPSEETALFTRRHICGYLTVPVYKKFHQWLGRTSLQPMWDAWDGGDRRGAAAAIPDQVVDELIVHGDWDEQRAHIKRYMDAGVDTAFLSLFSAERDPVERRKRIMEATRQLAPSAYR